MEWFTRIRRTVVTEQNAVLTLPPITPPLSSPFPVTLTSGVTIDPLAFTAIRLKCNDSAVLLNAVINWSATFIPPTTPATLNVAGYADITFEIALNGFVIYTVTQTAVQKGIGLQSGFPFSESVPTFELATLLHLDTLPLLFADFRELVYTLRATNIAIVPPQVTGGGATATAQVGAVTLSAQVLRSC
jgi:hypothetical protein